MADRRRDSGEDGDGLSRTLIGAATVAAAAGVAFLIGRKLMEPGEGPLISQAPPWTRRGRKGEEAVVGKTVTVNRPAHDLYAFWRDLRNLARFMDNVRAVEVLDDKRSRWTIAAPGGTEVVFTSRITEEQPGRLIAWEAEEDAAVRNSGRVEFLDAPPGRGSWVRLTIAYDPPLGAVGQAVAKVLQREPNVQARRDLRRFKQLMETGEVTSSAGPSGRESEDQTKQYL